MTLPKLPEIHSTGHHTQPGSWAQCVALIATIVSVGCAMHRAPAHQEPATHKWANVLRVPERTVISVRQFDGNTVEGVLQRADASSMTIDVGGSVVMVRSIDVSRVHASRQERDSLRNGALIGAAVGIAYAIAVWPLSLR